MTASLPSCTRSGARSRAARMRGVSSARSRVAPARSCVFSSPPLSWLEARFMTPSVRCSRRGWTTMEGSNPSIGGSCASQEVVSPCTALRRPAWWPIGSARKCVGRVVELCPLACGFLGGRASRSRCWVAPLESPEAGALRRGGRRRCWFELVDSVGVIIALVGRPVRLLRNVDLLCKSRVAIYGSQHS
jgi:hypothetical protein